jgi:hypothetical protein
MSALLSQFSPAQDNRLSPNARQLKESWDDLQKKPTDRKIQARYIAAFPHDYVSPPFNYFGAQTSGRSRDPAAFVVQSELSGRVRCLRRRGSYLRAAAEPKNAVVGRGGKDGWIIGRGKRQRVDRQSVNGAFVQALVI